MLYLEAFTNSESEPDPANYKLFTVSTICTLAMLLFLVFRAWLYDIIIANIAT